AWVRPAAAGSLLRVHVRPRSARAGIAGLHGEAVCVRVTAPPVDEAANRELRRVLAAALGVRPGDVSIEGGAHGRDKWVGIAGLAPVVVRARIEALGAGRRPAPGAPFR